MNKNLSRPSVGLFCWMLLLGVFTGCGDLPDSPAAAENTVVAETARIVSLNGTITELLYSLGFEEQIVGVDITSTYPTAAQELPKLGHVSQLNTEALLALQPTLVLVDAEQAEQATLDQLRQAGVQIAAIQSDYTLTNAVQAARQLQGYLPIEEIEITRLTEQITRDQAALDATLAQANTSPKVLFIYARGTGRMLVAGSETGAAAMIALAGGENAINEFEDFQALTPEALVAAAPEVLLLFDSGLASLEGVEGLRKIAGITETPAFQQERIVTMDGHYLLGFGPRAARAANDLAQQLITPKNN